MVLSKRERSAVLIMAAAVLLFSLDRFLLSPLLERRAQLETEIALQGKLLAKADMLFANNKRMQKRWSDMLAGGLKADASSAESQLLHAVRDWAQDAGLSLSSVQPEHTDQDKQFQHIVFRATGTGSMNCAARFLWRIQTAGIPVHVTDLQLSSRRDATDDLTIQIGISTLCRMNANKTTKPDANAPSREQI